MVNSKGEILERWIGYPGAELWATYARAGVSDQRTLAQKKEAYDKRPTVALARSLGNDAATVGEFRDAVTYFRKARELDPDMAGQYTSDILLSMYYGLRGDAFNLDDVEVEVREALSSDAIGPGDKVEAVYLVSNMARMRGEPDRVIPYLEPALAASANSTDEQVLETRRQLEIEHALLVEKDANKAVRLKKEAMPEGWRDDPDELNDFAWWCFENDLDLAEAEQLALRGAELAEDDGTRANILDTAAEIGNARGDSDAAIARIKQAIALNPDKQYFKDQLERFEDARKEKQKG